MTLQRFVRAAESLFEFRTIRSRLLVLLLLLTSFGASHLFFLPVRYFERESEQVILHSYRFLLAHPEHPEAVAMHRGGDREANKSRSDVYLSQVGLQYQALRLLHAIIPISERAAELLLRVTATSATSI